MPARVAISYSAVATSLTVTAYELSLKGGLVPGVGEDRHGYALFIVENVVVISNMLNIASGIVCDLDGHDHLGFVL